MKKEQEPISVKTAAALLEVSEMTVYRMLKAGKLNAIKRLVNRHRQSFISIDEKWEKAISKKYISVCEAFAEIKKSLEPSDKECAFKSAPACSGARAYATQAENACRRAQEYVAVAKEDANQVEADCESAAGNAVFAEEQAKEAKSASVAAERHCFSAKAFAEDSERHYFSAKACASDAFVQRKEAAESAAEAKREAESAMRCVVWCFCAAVLSLLFAIAHFIL